MNNQDIIYRIDILRTYLKQIVDWKSNLDQSKLNRKRKDQNDKETIQSIKYWYQGYLNGLQLHGWI